MATDSINTVARPYAKALFDIASEQKALDKWSKMLGFMSIVVEDEGVSDYIAEPGKTVEALVAFFTTICGDAIDDDARRLVSLLVENKRVMVMPAIFKQFEALKAQSEKTEQVEIIAFEALNDKQTENLKTSLKKRLNCDVELSITVDKSILGGAIIRARSLVIDGSVRSKLNALNLGLQDAV